MGFSPGLPRSEEIVPAGQIFLQDCIFTNIKGSTQDNDSGASSDVSVRAYTPTPKITLSPLKDNVTLVVNNVSPLSKLQIKGVTKPKIDETIDGINRAIQLTQVNSAMIELSWEDRYSDYAKFAVIGDTGGGDELDWCLDRAVQLGSQFMIHLGDFNYSEGEYQRAISAFHNAKLPVYIAIGNHDFNDSGLVYDNFLNQIGPFNSSFRVGDTRLILLDTAASFFPSYAGQRGNFVRELLAPNRPSQGRPINDTVIFTHKPFVDVRSGGHHVMSGINEQDWFKSSMQALTAETMICGHVHRSATTDYEGIKQITAGEGLGFEDIRHQRKSAKMMIANSSAGGKFTYQWEDINMPWEAHTSPTHWQKLERPELWQQKQWFKNLLSSRT